MYEYILHHIWHKQRFDAKDLTTSNGLEVQVVNPGTYNTNGGPDFINARIRIDGRIWVGAVEIHVNSSEWYEHMHHEDPSYQAVILHVCLNENRPVILSNSEVLPCIELKERIPGNQDWIEHSRLEDSSGLLCAPFGDSIPKHIWRTELDVRSLNRLQQRAQWLFSNFEIGTQSWETILNRQILSAFGMKTNKMAFDMLASKLDFKLISRIHDQPFKLEALIFGQAGFLSQEAFCDYQEELTKEYNFLRKAHDLTPLPIAIWNFLRMRPANFPTIRIAQLASFLSLNPNPIRSLRTASDLDDMKSRVFISTSDFWNTHYTFGSESETKVKQPGNSFIQSVLINGVIPALYADAIRKENSELIEHCTELLQTMKPESNTVTNWMKTSNADIRNAMDSQGAVELFQTCCKLKHCDRCSIGRYLLKSIVSDIDEGTSYSHMEVHR